MTWEFEPLSSNKLKNHLQHKILTKNRSERFRIHNGEAKEEFV